jgi:hypothetical protein
MEDLAETASIFAAKIARQVFGERVANRIRVTQALALDDFDRFIDGLKLGYN